MRRLVMVMALMMTLLGLGACEKKTDPNNMAPSGMAGAGAPAASGAAAAADPAAKVATVNGSELTRADLDRSVGSLLQSVGVPPDRVDATMARMVEARAMEAMISRELLKQESARRGHTVTDADISGALTKFKQGLPAAIPYEVWLQRMGLTDEVFKDEMRANVLIGKLQQEVVASIAKPTDEELKALYEAQKDRLARVEHGKAHQILVAVPPDAPFEMVEEARKEAAGIAAGLKGKDVKAFEKVARAKSDDERTKAKGGDLGEFEARGVLPDFWMAFRDLKKGEVSDPVRTDRGFVVIRSGGTTRGKDRSFNELKGQLMAIEVKQRNEKALGAMMKGLQDKAEIVRHYEPPPPPPRMTGNPGAPPPPGAGPGPGGPAGMPPGALPPGGQPLPPGSQHAITELPADGNLPLPSADNVLPGVRNPHGGGAPHGGGQQQPPSSDELKLGSGEKKPEDDLKLQ